MVSGFHPILNEDHEQARSFALELEARHCAYKPWGVFSSLVVGFFSLGTIPGLLWHDRFRDFVGEERQRLRKFADWMRLHSTRPETMDLRVAADDLSVRPLLSMLSMACVVGVFIFFAIDLNAFVASGTSPIQRVLSVTYKLPSQQHWTTTLSQAQRLFAAWSIGLSVAYLFHWLQVQAHAADVRRFARHANRIFRAEGVPRVPLPQVGIRLTLFWIGAAAFLAGKGAWWGIAMALSGGAQQHYMTTESLRLRRALAARVREMARLPMLSGEDRAPASLGNGVTRRCPNERCLAAVPEVARFCPRCGRNLTAYATPEGDTL